jgi:integrase/recombinase XerD
VAVGGDAVSVDLRAAAADYLSGRRARGYRLADHDWLIASFLDGLDARGVPAITVADAVAFAHARPGCQRSWQAARLRSIRGLAAYVHALDPAAADLIPAGLIAAKVTRRIPYLYSDKQVAQLMSHSESLSPPPLAASMHTLIGLCAATGLRSGEAVALDVDDICLDPGLLTVTGKYGRQRLVPLHPTTIEALRRYLQVRATRAAASGALLLGARGGRLNLCFARALFRSLVDDCALPARPGCTAPRLHDLRHRFAVETLIDAHREGVDIDARIAALATYLGHTEAANTYWYLTASAELMAVVSERIAAYQSGRRP